MEPLKSDKDQAAGLTLPPRTLRAALRKSASRAQRLAKAFDKVVPSVNEVPHRAPIKRA